MYPGHAGVKAQTLPGTTTTSYRLVPFPKPSWRGLPFCRWGHEGLETKQLAVCVCGRQGLFLPNFLPPWP